MNKKKLGLDVRVMAPFGTGIGSYMTQMTNELIKQLPSDEWEIHLFTSPAAKITENIKNNTYINSAASKIISIARRAVFTSPDQASKLKLDIFHSFDFLGPIWKKDFKLVQTMHDIIPLLFPENASLKSLIMYKMLMPVMFRSDDIIITTSDNNKKDILSKFSIPDEKLRVIPLGGSKELENSIEPYEFERVRNKLGINKDYFLFVGTIEPKKNTERIVDAYLSLPELHEKYSLVLAGRKGWNVDGTYKKASINKNIIFTGFVDDEDLNPLIKGASCFVFPSTYEGFGLPVLDAFHAGIPLITSNISSMPEVAGDAAHLVSPYDPDSIAAGMKKIVTDNDYRESLIEKGKEQVKNFSWEKTAKQTIDIYYDLLK